MPGQGGGQSTGAATSAPPSSSAPAAAATLRTPAPQQRPRPARGRQRLAVAAVSHTIASVTGSQLGAAAPAQPAAAQSASRTRPGPPASPPWSRRPPAPSATRSAGPRPPRRRQWHRPGLATPSLLSAVGPGSGSSLPRQVVSIATATVPAATSGGTQDTSSPVAALSGLARIVTSAGTPGTAGPVTSATSASGVDGPVGGLTGAVTGAAGNVRLPVTGTLSEASGTVLPAVTGTITGVTGTTLPAVTGTLTGATGTPIPAVTRHRHGRHRDRPARVTGTLTATTGTDRPPRVTGPHQRHRNHPGVTGTVSRVTGTLTGVTGTASRGPCCPPSPAPSAPPLHRRRPAPGASGRRLERAPRHRDTGSVWPWRRGNELPASRRGRRRGRHGGTERRAAFPLGAGHERCRPQCAGAAGPGASPAARWVRRRRERRRPGRRQRRREQRARAVRRRRGRADRPSHPGLAAAGSCCGVEADLAFLSAGGPTRLIPFLPGRFIPSAPGPATAGADPLGRKVIAPCVRGQSPRAWCSPGASCRPPWWRSA